jgi:hypothetical protein
MSSDILIPLRTVSPDSIFPAVARLNGSWWGHVALGFKKV